MSLLAKGVPPVMVCSTAFEVLGRGQARALGFASLPLAIVPHPFGSLGGAAVDSLVDDCVQTIVRHAAAYPRPDAAPLRSTGAAQPDLVELPDDEEARLAFCITERWSEGLPVVTPTQARVERALAAAGCAPDAVIGRLAPAMGQATARLVAANAVLAGCLPEHLPVVLAAVEALCAPEFNLQAIQTTTNPVTAMLMVSGPVVARLGLNAAGNALGEGTRANVAIGRAVRMVMRNVGGAVPGLMDRATHGQPGKIAFCCAENAAQGPQAWAPLHVERGFAAGSSTVTVMGAEGTLNINTHATDAGELLGVIADAMQRAPANDYLMGLGEPWLLLSPEHAAVLAHAGLSRAEVRAQLWQRSRLPAGRMASEDFRRTQRVREAELGPVGPGTLLPACATPDAIGLLVTGGAGTHSTLVPSFGDTRSVTREIHLPS